MLRKVLIRLVAVWIILLVPVSPLFADFTPPRVSPFVDVHPRDAFYKEITWLANEKITTGWERPDRRREFRPYAEINRDAMAAFLYRVSGQPAYTPPAVSPFADLKSTDSFYKEITWLAAQGITTGWVLEDGTREFRPFDKINRDAMAAFIYRLSGQPAYTSPSVSPFSDLQPDDSFYKEINWFASRGFTTGWDIDGCRQFRPLAHVKRDAMAAFLYRHVNGGVHVDLAPAPQRCRGSESARQLTNDFFEPDVTVSRAVLSQLKVNNSPTMAGYQRKKFGSGWLDASTWGWPERPLNSCDARQAALYRDGVNVVYNKRTCSIRGGSWLDPYTNRWLNRPSDADVDHIVPLADAWRSGASTWTDRDRRAFANNRLEVISVDDGANQSKGDKGPSGWKPPNAAAHCLYAKRWIAIKDRFHLTVTSSESEALSNMLTTCAR